MRIEWPEDLRDAQNRTVYKSEGEVREQERDITKLWIKGGAVISLIGLENQSVIDRTMPLRIFGTLIFVCMNFIVVIHVVFHQSLDDTSSFLELEEFSF